MNDTQPTDQPDEEPEREGESEGQEQPYQPGEPASVDQANPTEGQSINVHTADQVVANDG